MTPTDSKDRYFEDYIPGAVFEYGEIRVDEAEILEFARRFDPQEMHVDPEAASRGRFGGLMVRTLIEVLNQDGNVVMSLKPMNIIARRSQS